MLLREALERGRLVISARLVDRLVDEFNRLPALPRPVPSCPADDGSRVDALLAYPAGQRVIIGVGLTGCDIATNGSLERWAAGFGVPSSYREELVGELLRLTG
jgi:hypothetical protein